MPSVGMPGTLDPTFGAGGTVTTAITSGDNFVFGLAIDTSERTVAAGSALNGANYNFALARYNADGTLDPTFGTGGEVTTSFGPSDSNCNAVAIDSLGRIVAVGFYGNTSLFTHVAVARYNPNGTLDTSFGAGGEVIAPLGFSDEAESVAIDSTGRIVIAGDRHNGVNLDFAVARFTTDGALDPTFGAGGFVFTPFGSGNDVGRTVAIDSVGRIVVSGESVDGSSIYESLARYNPDGTLDATFGTGGKVFEPMGPNDSTSAVYGMTIDGSGRILVCGDSPDGSGNTECRVDRLNSDGTFDGTFGAGGHVITEIAGQQVVAYRVAVDGMGRPIVAGVSSLPNYPITVAVVRFSPDGSVDPTFGTGGVVVTPIGPSRSAAQALAIDGDGRIIAAGFALIDGNDEFALARYDGGDANSAPVANAGGPYSIAEGQSLTLNGAGSHDPDAGDTLTYSWDVNGDGIFGDATGINPTLTWSRLVALGIADGPSTYVVKVRVDDGHGHVVDSPATSLAVGNVPPAVAITGPAAGVRYLPLTFSVTAADPSPTDQAAGFTVTINWGDGQVQTVAPTANNGTGVVVSHAYTTTGSYTVTTSDTDKDGGVSPSVTRTIVISPAAVLPDPLNPGQNALYVGGTAGNDDIEIERQCQPGYRVEIETGCSEWHGTFAGPISRVVAYGGAGDDDIQASGGNTISAWLYGGDGNDRLKGGGSGDVLLGGAGDDLLVSGGDRDILIGGAGADRLVGGSGDDLIIGGSTAFDGNEVAMLAIQSEWQSARSYAARVANLAGTGTGASFTNRLNGAYYLRVTSQLATTTMFDDTSVDLLTGGSGQDWYFANLLGGGVHDRITDLTAAEFANDLTFIQGP